jgi:group I intron endonuclease
VFIYQITNTVTSDFYIGKTTQPIEKRYYKHKYNAFNLNCQTYLYRAMRKYGESNFKITIIEQLNDNNLLNEKEIHYIKTLSPKYNMTKGGDGGDTSNSPNYKIAIKNRDQSGSKNGMFGRKRPDTALFLLLAKNKMIQSNQCPVMCEGKKYDSVGLAQSAYPGISIRKRLDNPKYPEFYRLRPKTKRK